MNKKANFSEKTVLVAGGAGFLGAHLCERIIERGDRVICLDNLYTGSADNLDHLRSKKGFKFIFHDVCLPIEIDDQIDEIFNLACPASPPHYQKDPIYTTKISVLGAINMLELATRCNARILQASTSEVYGDPTIHPQTEDYRGNVNPIGIRSCYDEGKRCAESLFYDYHRRKGTDIRVARIFNTYGPGMDPRDGRVVSNFIVQALAGEDLTIYGNGSQTRSFCFRDDLVEGLVRLMDSGSEVGFPVNIGNPNEFTILALAEMVIELTGSASKMLFCPSPEDDPSQRRPDISKALTYLEWTPKVQLREGLLQTIEYFRGLHRADGAEQEYLGAGC